ncbi:MAG: hypothetical protein M3N93_08305 [Acidobacteriota bacterium]|nr:hypothetical protein [Acidobacteriota bacterium]
MSPDKQREVFDYVSDLQTNGAKKKPFASIEGLWADLGISLSADEIEHTQREMWRGFPRDDV